MTRYAEEREAKFRGGIRILLAGAVLLITWCLAWLGLFAASGPWNSLHRPSIRAIALWSAVALLTLAGLVLAIALLRAARWRWTASGVWAGTVVATAVLIALPSAGGWEGGLAFGLVGVGIVGAYGWTLVKFDPPAT